MLLQAGRIALKRTLGQGRQFGILSNYPFDQFTQRQKNSVPVVIVGLQAVAVRRTKAKERVGVVWLSWVVIRLVIIIY